MIRTIGQRVGVAAAAAVLSAGGMLAIAGTAFAHDHGNSEGHDGHDGYSEYDEGSGGDGGNGGNSNANCVVPLGVSAGVIGQGGPVSQCNSTSGNGGDGGDGTDGGDGGDGGDE